MESNSAHAGPTDSDTTAELLRALSARIDSLDRAGAVTLALEAVAENRIGIADLYVQVLAPYLAEIGSRWQHGSEPVWQEHFASHAVRAIVEALYPSVIELAVGVAPRDETVLLVCPPDEQHELGLRMLSDRFELAGYRAIFLGADTPIDDIVSAALVLEADIVAMSVSTLFERVELRSIVDQVGDRLPGVRVLLGGPAFARDAGMWPEDELIDPAQLGLPGTPQAG
jgi:MerR family transcriptional regulator, light-induced transcriptional regulator